MGRTDVPVHMNIFRGIDSDHNIRQTFSELVGVGFHNQVRAVIKGFIIARRFLKIHQVNLIVCHAAGGDGGMSVKDQAGTGSDVFFDAAVKRFEVFVRPGAAHGS